LNDVLSAVSRTPEVKEVYLHVWAANDGAKRFYSRFGFAVGETVAGYYRRIDPPDAVVLRLAVNGGPGPAPATGATPPAGAA
jgi:ribosomal protein S18 acetylase RimI-like enzyme